jgi:hypothetical protein
MDQDYTNREIDSQVHGVHQKLDMLIVQTTKTNGRVTKLEKFMLILGTATTVIIALRFPELLSIVKLF